MSEKEGESFLVKSPSSVAHNLLGYTGLMDIPSGLRVQIDLKHPREKSLAI